VNATFTIASSAATGLRNVTVTTAAGTSNALTFTVNPSTLVFTPIRINAGGAAYTDTKGNLWSADSNYNSGSLHNTTNTISGTSDQPLFQTFHQSPETNPTVYTFNGIPNGNYTVTLDFAESHYTSVGSRVFNVSINGSVVLSNFDIFATAGQNTALSESFPVTVTVQIAIQSTPSNRTYCQCHRNPEQRPAAHADLDHALQRRNRHECSSHHCRRKPQRRCH
jgi:hypothetical protein